MTPAVLDAVLGLVTFAGLATLAASPHQAEWRALGSAMFFVGAALALVNLAAGGVLVLGVVASRPLRRGGPGVPDRVPPDWHL